MTKQLMCIGECMVELAPASGGLFAKGYAGDTFNTAWYAKRMADDGLSVSYLTAVGDDAASLEMLDFMKTEGVDPLATAIPGRTVGLYMIALKDGERSFSYWRSVSAAKHLAKGLDKLSALNPGDLAYFSGITLAILEPETRGDFLDALSAVRDRGVTVAFDPNLRPKLWENPKEMTDWITQGAGVADIVLPSFEDEAEFFADADIGATAARYMDAGAKLVIVKDAENDVLIRAKDQPDAIVKSDTVTDVVDSTAAGDSFNAAFFVNWLDGKSTESSTKAGCQLAAKVISGRGALVRV